MDALLKEHFGYLRDTFKLKRYADAIARVVDPRSTVLDLGCGSGVLGLSALRAGAARVHFLDETPILELARETVFRAGYGARAVFHRGNSFEIALAERADLVLCDHVGYFGFDYDISALLADAKERFLRPGGTLIPGKIDLKVAGISSERCCKPITNWNDGTVPSDYAWVSSIQSNVKHNVDLKPEDLICEPVLLGSVNLGERLPPFVSWTAQLICSRDGRFDGLGGWFECQLVDDIWMTNSPLADARLARSQVFLGGKIPVRVRQGEVVKATVMARPSDRVIAWQVEFPEQQLHYSRSTVNAVLLDGADLARANSDRVAALSAHGRAHQVILSYCDGWRTVAEVEALVLAQHPGLAPTREALSAMIWKVLGRDTEA